MSVVLAGIFFHVAMGAAWLLATLAVAATGRGPAGWLRLALVAAGLNMAAGIYLWRALHSGPWGTTERLLVIGTFSAFVALGLQLPITLTLPREPRRLERPALVVYRISAVFVVVAATAMVASWVV